MMICALVLGLLAVGARAQGGAPAAAGPYVSDPFGLRRDNLSGEKNALYPHLGGSLPTAPAPPSSPVYIVRVYVCVWLCYVWVSSFSPRLCPCCRPPRWAALERRVRGWRRRLVIDWWWW